MTVSRSASWSRRSSGSIGHDVPITEAPPRPGDAVGAFANVDRAAELLDWQTELVDRRGDRLGPGVGRPPPGSPGLRVTRPYVVSLAAAVIDCVGEPGDAGLGHARLPRHGAVRRDGSVRPAQRTHRGDRPGPPARQPPLPRPRSTRLVPAGGFKKPCNTTGTATNAGYPEATFTWQVSQVLQETARGTGRHRRADPPLQQRAPLGSVRRRPGTGRQRAPRRPQDQHPRRRLLRGRGARLPRDRPDRPPALDPRHLQAFAQAGARHPGSPARGRVVGGELHRGRRRTRLPLRPRPPSTSPTSRR